MAEAPLVDGYSDLQPVGRGGFSTVYRARQDRFARDVALKVLDVGRLDDRTQARFLRECEVMGRLSSHPGIVTIYDAGTTSSGVPYLAMELMAGGSLGQRVRESGPMRPTDVATAVAQIAGALDTAHDEGILHRDIKPENLLVSQWGHTCLADFGIATFADRGSGTFTSDALTPSHAAPEILEGASPTVASDVYSLASTVYALLAGRPAFQQEPNEGHMPFWLRIIDNNVPPLVLGEAAMGVDEVVRGAMAKDPASRPATASAFAALLTAAIEASPATVGTGPGGAATAPRSLDDGDLSEVRTGQDEPGRTVVRPRRDRDQPAARPESIEDPPRDVAPAPGDRNATAPPSGEPAEQTVVHQRRDRPAPAKVDASPAGSRRRAWLIAASSAVLVLGLGFVLLREDRGGDAAGQTRKGEHPSTTVERSTTTVPRTSTSVATTIPSPTVTSTIAIGETGLSMAASDTRIWVDDAEAVTTVDTATAKVLGRFGDRAGSFTGHVTWGGDHLWWYVIRYSLGETNDVEKVDPVSGEPVVAASAPALVDMIVSGDSLWQVEHPNAGTGGFFARRRDPSTLKVTASVTLDGSNPCRWISALASGGGSVWFACERGGEAGEVIRVDPVTNAVTARIATGAKPAGVTFGAGAIWVTNFDGQSVQRIDAATNEVSATIKVEGAPKAITFGANRLWVTTYQGASVVTIDPETNKVSARVEVGRGPDLVAFSAGSAWVSNSLDGTLSRVTP